MPRKIARPDADVERLATELRKRWVPADGIKPWLRRHAPRLRRMVRDEGWSWEDIGRALTMAGIVYGSGVPWTGKVLTVKVSQARAQLRARARKAATAAAPPVTTAAKTGPAPVRTVSPPMVRPDPEGEGEPAPTFELASLAPNEFVPSTPSQDSGGISKPSPAPRSINADEVIRRIRGGSADSGSEE